IECLLRYVLSLLALCFLHATAPTEIYTLSLHDALPISSVGRGFTGELRQRLRLAIGDGPAGRAALEQRSIFLPELKGEPQKGAAVAESQQEEFASYMAVPMFAKGQLQGVIELYTKNRLEPNDEWLEFLETYADQRAIA